ncbi:hypothetical protein [Rheinheimera aquimaris]|uniref:hypothetical protein n=1 Tax=Rheinheimera aquimaris TaxID=412437 RepID=UPI0010651BC6|nr:hypothetical protein [Rheinheimera aquimaris]
MKQFALMILLGAATQVQAAIPAEQAIELCRAEQNALRRLNCYDAISADTSVAAAAPVARATQSAAPQQPTVSQPQPAPAATAESSFGLEHKKSSEQTTDKIYVTVKTVSENQQRELVVEFTNGQIWRQRGNDYYQIKAGEKHYIKRGVLGSFFLGNDDNNRTIRVKREQ